MSSKIQSTTNYSRFKMMEGNRPLHKRVGQLKKAIQRKNMLAQYPIVVSKNCDGRYYVCDGQNRLAAAKELGLPIFYVETRNMTIADVASANSAQQRWCPRDYVGSFAAQGNADYIALSDFITEFGLSVSTAVSLMAGILNDKGETRHSGLMTGDFKAKNKDFARRVAQAVLSVPFTGRKDRSFVLAIARLMQTKVFSFARFAEKLKSQPSKLTKCASWEQYVELIEEIYNWRARAADMAALSIEVKKQAAK